ncbi:hypothetical protein EMIT0194MI4_20409 [Pseudomonas sp. IT-194MI4]
MFEATEACRANQVSGEEGGAQNEQGGALMRIRVKKRCCEFLGIVLSCIPGRILPRCTALPLYPPTSI